MSAERPDPQHRAGMRWHTIANDREMTRAMNTAVGVIVRSIGPTGLAMVVVPGLVVAKRWVPGEPWTVRVELVPSADVHVAESIDSEIQRFTLEREEHRIRAWRMQGIASAKPRDDSPKIIEAMISRYVEIDGPMPEIPEALLAPREVEP